MKGNFKDNCQWSSPSANVDIRVADFSKSDWNFMAIEGLALPAEDQMPLSENLFHITTFRHPLDRMLSHYKHQVVEQLFRNTTFTQFIAFEPPEHWTANYYTQLLGGCMNIACTRRHLEIAKKRLHSFIAVLITDNSDTYELSSIILRSRLGWKSYDVSMVLVDD